MTLPIFICDDDEKILERYQRIISNAIMINEYDMKILVATTDIQDIRDYLKLKPRLTDALFFLDIDLHGSISGIDAAVEIRTRDEYAQIVFVTSHRELAFETLKRRIAALDFIQKADDDKTQILDLLVSRNQVFSNNGHQEHKYFQFRVGSREIRVDFKAIYYIEASTRPHKVVLYGENFMYEFYAKLSDIAADYSDLLRVHKSFLINPGQVISIDFKRREIYFPDDYSCTFPLAMVRQLRKIYQ